MALNLLYLERKKLEMKTNENGITLLSLVITVIVLAILASLMVELSLKDNDAINVVRKGEETYYEQKGQTQNRILDMTNGWEDILE